MPINTKTVTHLVLFGALATSLTLAQPERAGRPAQPGGGASAFIDRLMAGDADEDGKLSREELPERFSALFDRGDANKDNFLDKAELESVFAQRAGGGRQDAQRRGGRGGRAPNADYGDHMSAANDALDTLHKSDLDADSRATDIEAANALQGALVGAKSQAESVPMPRQAQDKFGDDQDAYTSAMRRQLIATLRAALDLESALIDGDSLAARAHIDAVGDARDMGHDAFGDND